jgi:nucleoside-diphosphate-sugar epimerase
MISVLVTGANGFIGRAFCARAVRDGLRCRGAIRGGRPLPDLPAGTDAVSVGKVGPETDWAEALSGIDIVVHLAARAHVLRETAADPLVEFRLVNTEGTRRLARQAATACVRRFIFVSSIGVNGDSTHERPFREDDPPHPARPYALSKWEAEVVLQDLSAQTGMETVILRPPLVYGPGVKGNMRLLMEYVNRGWPLPFAGVHNRRSLLGLGNLVDALMLCVVRPEAAGQTFLLCDGEDISTADLIRQIARASGKKDHLFAVPDPLFRGVAKLAPFARAKLDQVLGSLAIDNSRFRTVLKWSPPYGLDEEIASMVNAFLREKGLHGKKSV